MERPQGKARNVIAAFQMYDWPEVQDRHDRFWAKVGAALRARAIAAPEALMRPERLSSPWVRDDLLLGQTCGLPYVAGRCGTSAVVARPCFGVEGAAGGTYTSAIICRTEALAPLAAFRGKRAAINEFGSQSGCNALADAVQQAGLDANDPFFGDLVISGAHRNSARMVSEGQADIAAIDAVAWALFAELEPERRAALSVVQWTRAMPALPFITGRAFAARIPDLYDALTGAADPANPVGVPRAMVPATDADYDPIRQMSAQVTGMKLAPSAAPI